MCVSRKVRHEGPTAGRDQYALGGQFLPVGEADRLRADHGRARLEHGDLVIVERLAVEALEPRDLREHIVAQPRPVEAAVGHVPAELAGVVNILRAMGAIDEQLLGHAATDGAGAAEAIFLRPRDARSVRGSNPAGPTPPRTGAKYTQVDDEFGPGKNRKRT